jgi:hypothetical protein
MAALTIMALGRFKKACPESSRRVRPALSVLSEIEGKAAAMNRRREKGKVKRNGKRGQLCRYDSFDFSRFTTSKNAAGGFFQQTQHEYGQDG